VEQMTVEQMTRGQMTRGQMTRGQMTRGQMTRDQMTRDQMTGEQMTGEQYGEHLAQRGGTEEERQEAADRGHAERIIDVREWTEYLGGHLQDAACVPLEELEQQAAGWTRQGPVTVVCRSGRRASDAARRLERLGFVAVTVLTGGMEAWVKAGGPVVRGGGAAGRRVWAMERQVRVVAGGLVLGFGVLGWTVARGFFSGSMLVGAGLVFAGVSDTCMMGNVLRKLPWNRS
jgi:rhodanese-related sulfurtransferase